MDDSEILAEFYTETDPVKRQQLLADYTAEAGELTDSLKKYREKLWNLRYGKGKPRNDAFIGHLMTLKYLYESNNGAPGPAVKKQAVGVLVGLGMTDPDRLSEDERQALFLELKNTVLRYMKVSCEGRGFTSLVFGMGKLSDEGITKKIAEQISTIAYSAPHMLRMDKEFALLQKAAEEAFNETYPNRLHLLKKG